jgi:UDP-N-acetyl-D-mannosaminuronic acid dehydrogenase
MRNPDKILIQTNKSIKHALSQLTKTKEKLLICIDKSKKFVGVINDGDIRRAILSGAKLNVKIEKYVNKKSTFVTNRITEQEASKLVTSRIVVLPVINSFQYVVGYYSFKGKEQNFNVISNEITVIGMGYVGLTLSVILSEIGFKVIGFDKNKDLINKLNKKIIPFYEKDLSKYIEKNVYKKLFFRNNFKKINSSIFVISVGTPIKKNKKPALANLNQAIDLVGKNLKKGNLVVLRSTLPVGTTRDVVIPRLERNSNLKAGKDFSVSFAPERSAEGNALKELKENPQIIGGFDEKSSEKTANFFNTFTHSIVHVSSLEAAEFCKLIDNSYRDHRFAFINQFIKFSEKMNLDLAKIVKSVNHGYSRNDIPMPSPGVGGPCLSKDPHILSHNLESKNLSSSLIRLSRKTNESIVPYLSKKITYSLKKIKKDINNSKIFIVGMSFKGNPETSDVRNSSSIDLLQKLKSKKNNICVYDPYAKFNTILFKELKIKIVSLKEGFKKADAVIIMTNNKNFNELTNKKYLNSMNKPSIFLDTWHIFDPIELKQFKGINYYGLGND